MKKTFILLSLLGISMVQAQVGINNEEPQATLNVKSEAGNQTKKNLELEDSTGKKLMTVMDNGKVVIGELVEKIETGGQLTVITPGSSKFRRNTAFFTPDLSKENSTHITLGKNSDKSNNGSVDFLYRGDQSELNGIGLNTSGYSANRKSFILFAQANGNVGIGTNSPTQKLDVNGNARFRGLPNVSGADTDKVVVVDNTGVLKTVNRESLSQPTFTNLPTYNSDDEADADTNLLSGSLYKLTTAGRQVFVKP